MGNCLKSVLSEDRTNEKEVKYINLVHTLHKIIKKEKLNKGICENINDGFFEDKINMCTFQYPPCKNTECLVCTIYLRFDQPMPIVLKELDIIEELLDKFDLVYLCLLSLYFQFHYDQYNKELIEPDKKEKITVSDKNNMLKFITFLIKNIEHKTYKDYKKFKTESLYYDTCGYLYPGCDNIHKNKKDLKIFTATLILLMRRLCIEKCDKDLLKEYWARLNSNFRLTALHLAEYNDKKENNKKENNKKEKAKEIGDELIDMFE